MKPIDKSYNELNGCHSCKFVFVKSEYEEAPDYFCHFDKSKRPDCGSVLMEENFFREGAPPYEIAYPLWDKWEEEHKVKAWGFCNRWKKAPFNTLEEK